MVRSEIDFYDIGDYHRRVFPLKYAVPYIIRYRAICRNIRTEALLFNIPEKFADGGKALCHAEIIDENPNIGHAVELGFHHIKKGFIQIICYQTEDDLDTAAF